MPPSSIFIHWFKDKYPTMDTKQLQSLAENLVEFANLTNPEVSSDSSLVRSESEPNSRHSGDEHESSGTLSSIPLGQGSPKVVHEELIDNTHTARNSSTDVALLDEVNDQIHTPSEPPQLPSIQERNQSVITCPTGTCDTKTIDQLPSIEDNLDSTIDEVFSPAVTRDNYPILFNFAAQPISQVIQHDAAEVIQADHHETVQPPPEPPDYQAADQVNFQGRRPRRFPRVDYEALNEYGVQGRRLQGGLGGRRDRERRGAPE